MNAEYLFQQDKHYDVNYDTGDKTIQCGRHVDVFKFWLMWRAKVDNGSILIRLEVSIKIKGFFFSKRAIQASRLSWTGYGS
jgi:hypothetical protein